MSIEQEAISGRVDGRPVNSSATMRQAFALPVAEFRVAEEVFDQTLIQLCSLSIHRHAPTPFTSTAVVAALLLPTRALKLSARLAGLR